MHQKTQLQLWDYIMYFMWAPNCCVPWFYLPPIFPTTVPSISVPQSEVFTSVGQPTVLLCDVNGTPPPDIVWSKGKWRGKRNGMREGDRERESERLSDMSG